MTGRRSGLLLGLLALALTSAGCGSGSSAEPPPRTSFHSYVAVGDTFAAAPYTGRTRPANGCHRSTTNYPTRLAKALSVSKFVDASCEYADSTNLLRPQQTRAHHGVAPQIALIDKDTDLVTVNLGGNNLGYFAAIQRVCGKAARGCHLAAYENVLGPALVKLRAAVAGNIRAIRDRAPRATIVLLGYPRTVGDSGACGRLPHLSAADRAAWQELEKNSNLQLGRAARDTGAVFVDVYAASLGHDVCSSRPWVRGSTTDHRHGVAYGPLAAEQSAVATLVEQALRSDVEPD